MQVAFVGNDIVYGKEAENTVRETILWLIEEEGADVFLFGSHSRFDDLCYNLVSHFKQKRFPEIKRVLVRAEYPYLEDADSPNWEYREYLLTQYEETYFPDKAKGATRLSYVKWNEAMIDRCDMLVAYCKYDISSRGSGTAAALRYAKQKKKRHINIYDYMWKKE